WKDQFEDALQVVRRVERDADATLAVARQFNVSVRLQIVSKFILDLAHRRRLLARAASSRRLVVPFCRLRRRATATNPFFGLTDAQASLFNLLCQSDGLGLTEPR